MPSDPLFDVDIIQSGPPVDTTIADPIFDVDVIQNRGPVDADASTPFFDVEFMSSGQVEDVLVLEGPGGPPGPAGIPAPGAYYAEINFAVADTTWQITLPDDVSSYAASIDASTFDGQPMRGEVRRPDPGHIEIHWYYPTTGIARVYR